MKNTQHTKILNCLDDSKWHCSNELRDLFVPEYRSRINELRKKGYDIEGLRCNLHQHIGISFMWRLESTDSVSSNDLVGHTPENCPSWNIFKEYCGDCKGLKVGNKQMVML